MWLEMRPHHLRTAYRWGSTGYLAASPSQGQNLSEPAACSSAPIPPSPRLHNPLARIPAPALTIQRSFHPSKEEHTARSCHSLPSGHGKNAHSRTRTIRHTLLTAATLSQDNRSAFKSSAGISQRESYASCHRTGSDGSKGCLAVLQLLCVLSNLSFILLIKIRKNCQYSGTFTGSNTTWQGT